MLPLRPRRSLRPLRRRLTRRAVLWYAAALALTALTAGTVHATLRDAAAARAAYGETVGVVVATAEVAAGDPVDASVATTRLLPRALVPAGALRGAPPGRPALAALVPGEVVLAGRIAGGGTGGLAALLAPGERAVPVPLAVPGLELAPGDHVDVVAGGATGGGPDGDLPVGPGPPRVVAADARVLATAEETVVVAVPAPAARALAAALTAGPVLAALRPPGG